MVHVSKDEGDSWQDITPAELPEWSLISMIEPSPHSAGTAYMAATRYKLGDNSPMLFKTEDYGEQWTAINGNLPGDDFTRCIREDPVKTGMLYAGTETTLYVSFDDGIRWRELKGNGSVGKSSLPVVPIYDIAIKEDDMIVATHGRSFWILDDLTQLRQVPEIEGIDSPHILQPRNTIRIAAPLRNPKAVDGKNYQLSLGAAVTYTEVKNTYGEVERSFLDAGQNPPSGVLINYFLPKEIHEELSLTFLDQSGNVVVTYSNGVTANSSSEEKGDQLSVASNIGMNRFIWDMRYPPANKVPGDKTTEDRVVSGPIAPPGRYTVVLKCSGTEKSKTFEIIKDPRVEASQKELEDQFNLLLSIRDRLSETHDSINRIRSVCSQINEWTQRAIGHSSETLVTEAAEKITGKLSAIEAELIQTEYQGARDRLNLPTRLNSKLSEITSVVSAGDFAPTRQSYEVFQAVSDEIEPHLVTLQDTIDEDVKDFDNLVQELGLPAVVVRPQ